MTAIPILQLALDYISLPSALATVESALRVAQDMGTRRTTNGNDGARQMRHQRKSYT